MDLPLAAGCLVSALLALRASPSWFPRQVRRWLSFGGSSSRALSLIGLRAVAVVELAEARLHSAASRYILATL